MQPSGPARAGAAISVLIKVQPPRPPRPRPRPSYLPIAIKSPTPPQRLSQAHPAAPCAPQPGRHAGDGPRLRAQTGGGWGARSAVSFLPPRLSENIDRAGMLAPLRTSEATASGPLPRAFFFQPSPSLLSLLTLRPFPPPTRVPVSGLRYLHLHF